MSRKDKRIAELESELADRDAVIALLKRKLTDYCVAMDEAMVRIKAAGHALSELRR